MTLPDRFHVAEGSIRARLARTPSRARRRARVRTSVTTRAMESASALALALAQGDPREVLRAFGVRASGGGDAENDVGTSDEAAQERLASALRTCEKFSPGYAARAARRAIGAIVEEGGARACVCDALAERVTSGDEAVARGSGIAPESEGWKNRVYLYAPTRSERAGAIARRESSAVYALGETADAIFARTQSDALAGSTGAFAWPAGFVACEFALSRLGDALIRGRRVVELGSGTGVTATALSRAEPSALTLTDRDEATLENLAANVRLNAAIDRGVSTDAIDALSDVSFDNLNDPVTLGARSIRALDWERAETSAMAALDAEFVLAADCSYDPTLIPGLVRALRALLKAPNSSDTATTLRTLGSRDAESYLVDACASVPSALVLSAVRQEETMQVLIDSLERAGLHPVDVTSAVDALRDDDSAPKFLFREASRMFAHDAFRAFACTAASA